LKVKILKIITIIDCAVKGPCAAHARRHRPLVPQPVEARKAMAGQDIKGSLS
jgi:hypothetical protein